MSTINMKAVFKAAKAILEEKGWIQRRAEGPNGQVCLMQAVSQAASNETRDTGESFYYFDLEARLRTVLGGGHKSMTSWNDQPGRTKDEILGLLDKAAA